MEVHVQLSQKKIDPSSPSNQGMACGPHAMPWFEGDDGERLSLTISATFLQFTGSIRVSLSLSPLLFCPLYLIILPSSTTSPRPSPMSASWCIQLYYTKPFTKSPPPRVTFSCPHSSPPLTSANQISRRLLQSRAKSLCMKYNKPANRGDQLRRWMPEA